MFSRLALPVGPWELLKRTAGEVVEDDVLSLAAQQSYYFFFSLFPALLTLVSIASFFPLENLTDEVVRYLGRLAPEDVLQIINQQILRHLAPGEWRPADVRVSDHHLEQLGRDGLHHHHPQHRLRPDGKPILRKSPADCDRC